ncbi:MAG: hypothetical protein FJW35_14700 [Acidobacteria bacterium]|nr:hypothetical protein [Acidobacteriota bacterium]
MHTDQRPCLSSDRELELRDEVMRAMVEQAMARIIEHIRTLPEQPTSKVSGGLELAQSVRERLPESKTEYGKILENLFEKWIPRSFNTASPGYLAYIPGGGLFHSAVADLIADATNRYVGVWAAAPALAELEANVIRWFGARHPHLGRVPGKLHRHRDGAPQPAAGRLPPGSDLCLRPGPSLGRQGSHSGRIPREKHRRAALR